MITVQGLFKAFDTQKVLQDVSLEIRPGELLVILGASGSGKSVFLQHLIGLMKPDRGTIEIEGREITGLRERDLLKLRRDIGYLFQDGALYDFMTVYENVAFPLEEHTRLRSGEIQRKVLEMLRVVGLQEAAHKLPSELSGGMRKRAALARSVILDTKVLLCDEPTSGLDPIMSRSISDLIREISRKMNSTTVVTSHDMANALRIADRLVLIHEGRIAASGDPEAFRRSDHPVVKAFLE